MGGEKSRVNVTQQSIRHLFTRIISVLQKRKMSLFDDVTLMMKDRQKVANAPCMLLTYAYCSTYMLNMNYKNTLKRGLSTISIEATQVLSFGKNVATL